MKIDWVKKLTSRKLWLAIAGLVAGLILAFKGDAATAEVVSGVIMSIASVVAYIFGEGFVDAFHDDYKDFNEDEAEVEFIPDEEYEDENSND